MKAYPKIKSWYVYFRAVLIQHFLRPLKIVTSRIKYPGKENISLLDIGRFFITGLRRGEIKFRARAISFDFFLAIFPSIIFFFTLIPYIPVAGLQEKILILLQGVLPANTFESARTTIEDIILRQRGGLLSFGFIFALYVSTKGINSLISGFNQSYHGIEVRKGYKQRMVSVFLTLMLAIIVILSLALILFAEFASNYLKNYSWLTAGPRIFALKAGTWLILIIMSLIMISFLYYFGPSKKNKRPFISVGSVTATMLLITTTFAFNFFIKHFSHYNKIYGSIGTLIVILLWINFNAVQLILGFELNASIENAMKKAAHEKMEKKIYRSI